MNNSKREIGQAVFLVCLTFMVSCAGHKKVVKEPVEEGKAPITTYKGPGDANKEIDLGFQVISEGEAKGKIDYDTALLHFKNAYEADPKHIYAYLNSGICYERMGNFAEAEKMYLKAIEINPEFIQAYFNLGRVYSTLNQPERAIKLYEDFLKKYPAELKIKNNLAGVYCSMGKYEKAIEVLQDVLKRDPKNSQAYKNLSKIYFDQKRYELSKLLSANAQKLNPSDPDIANNLGITFLNEGDEISAVKAFKDALKIDPKNVEANMNLGLIAIKSGDYNLAKNCFSTVTQLFPGNLEARLSLALALKGLREFDSAIKEYEAVLSLSPDNPIALFNLGVLYEISLMNYDKAIAYYDKYIETQKESITSDDPVFKRLEKAKQERDSILKAKAEEEQRKKLTEEAKAKLKADLDEFKSFLSQHRNKFAPEEIQDMEYVIMECDMAIEQEILEMIEDMHNTLKMASKDYRNRIADKILKEQQLEEAKAKGKSILEELEKILNENKNDLSPAFLSKVQKSLDALKKSLEGVNRTRIENSIKVCTPLKDKILETAAHERAKREKEQKLLSEQKEVCRTLIEELTKSLESYKNELQKSLIDEGDKIIVELKKVQEVPEIAKVSKAVQLGRQFKSKLSIAIDRINAKKAEEKEKIESLKSEITSLISSIEASMKEVPLLENEVKDINDALQSTKKKLEGDNLTELEEGLRDIKTLNVTVQKYIKDKREKKPSPPPSPPSPSTESTTIEKVEKKVESPSSPQVEAEKSSSPTTETKKDEKKEER